MLVQIRSHSLRLITQHDHGLLAGRLAHEWCGPSNPQEPLPFEVVLATALHDLAWQPVDQKPLLNPENGQPYGFTSYPLEDKLDFYQKGLDRVAELDAYAGLLGSLHYTTFKGTEGLEPFQTQEHQRRQRLRQRANLNDEELIQTHLRYLKLFDNVSLFICLTPPGAHDASQPSWLKPSHFARTPEGQRFRLSWQSEQRLLVDPFPFRSSLRLFIPYRQLTMDSTAAGGGNLFDNEASLLQAWEQARLDYWSVSIDKME